MARYLFTRIAIMIPLLAVVLFIVFALGYFAPGDPISIMYAQLEEDNPGDMPTITDEQIARERAQFGLDRPFLVQYVNYVGNVLTGDLGTSITRRRNVTETIGRVFPISAQLGLVAGIGLLAAGIPLGILAALKHNTRIDYLIVGTSLFIRTVPPYVLAPLLMLILVLQLDIMDVPYGWSGLLHTDVILPAFLLMAYPLAVVIRQMRAGMLEVLGNDYVRTARAKGLRQQRLVVRHILPNAITPVVTSFGLIVTGLITGSVFIEQIFGIPGFGQLVVNSITSLDYPLMMGCTLFASFLVMLSNLIVDLIYPLLDPRVAL